MNINGIEVELEITPGFTVYNQDGTSYIQVYVKPHIIGGGPDGPSGGGEPLPEPKSA